MSPTRSIDGYAVTRELGRGGMGVVYEVQDQVGRPLALKLLPKASADPEALLRFAQESEVLARVRHPNVVLIHGVGQSDQGPYMVTERVEGDPLDRVLGAGPLPARHAATILRDLCGAVSALHAAGVIHRDIKPENVILRPDGTPVLIDFGLARDETRERLTQTGTVMGTPNYMSPEQARGETHRIGPACDVYGLGAVLFALLAGVGPFNGLRGMVLLGAIDTLEPDWPTGAGLAVPRALQAIGRRAMSKEPEGRPDAAVFGEELNRFLEGGLTGSPARWPLFLGAGAGVALLLLVGVYAADSAPVESPSTTPAPPRQAEDPRPVSPDRVRRDLRKSPGDPGLLRQARELLASPAGRDSFDLRRAYVKASFKRGPVLVSKHLELPRQGLARWFDDERIVATSKEVRALWRWEGHGEDTPWRKFYYTRGEFRGSPPLVFGSQAFFGGGDKSAPAALSSSWEAETPTHRFPAPTRVLSIAAWGAVGGRQLLAVGTQGEEDDEEGTILIFDPRSGEQLHVLRGHRASVNVNQEGETKVEMERVSPEVRALAFSRDGRWLISGGHAGDTFVWDVGTWEVHLSKELADATLLEVAVHPTQPLVAVCAGRAREVFLLRIPGLEEVGKLGPHALGHSTGVGFSRDGRLLFAVSGEHGRVKDARVGELVVYDLGPDLKARELVDMRSFEQQALNSVDVSPDGRRLVTFSRGEGRIGILEVWDIDVPPPD